jgi:hypothetical protein
VFSLGVLTLPKLSSSNPISTPDNKEGTTIPSTAIGEEEKFGDSSSENVTEPKYEKDDIVSTMVAEFLFLVAGDHVFLPEPSDREEDLELHKNARIFATLLTRLNCTRRVLTLLNDTAQEIDVLSWGESSGERHLFAKIFDRVVNELKREPEVYAEFLREEKRHYAAEPELHQVRENRVMSAKTKTFYDLTSAELLAVEELLDSRLVKKVLLTIELLKQTEESLDAAPKSAQLYRKRLQTAKATFKLAESEDVETRLRIQEAFDEALDEALEHFETVFGNPHQDILCDSLAKKIEDDELLKREFYCIKNILK